MEPEKQTCLNCHFLVWYLGISEEHLEEVTRTDRLKLENTSCYEIKKLQKCAIGCAYFIWEPQDFKILKNSSPGAHSNLDDKIETFQEIMNHDRSGCEFWQKYDYLISIKGGRLIKERELQNKQAAVERKFHQEKAKKDRKILGATLGVLTVATLVNIITNFWEEGIPFSLWVLVGVLIIWVVLLIFKK